MTRMAGQALRMPMNFSYTQQGPSGWGFYGLPGTPATTMDAIIEGQRTSTLRKGLAGALRPGSRVLFHDSRGREQPVIVTDRRMVDPSMAVELSQTERWTPEFLDWYMRRNGLEGGRMEQLLYQLPQTAPAAASPPRIWTNRPGDGYEVSSRGDRRFSALHARLPDGRTIEDAWGQAKGYSDGRAAKGRPALTPGFDYWKTYKGLWAQWASANPGLMQELSVASQGRPLVDRFARTENNQARALAELLAEGGAATAPSAASPPRIWAFGGARSTPLDMQELIAQIAQKHVLSGGAVVHGGAPGADRSAGRLIADPSKMTVYIRGNEDPRGPDPVRAGGRVFNAMELPAWQQARAFAAQYEDPYRPGSRDYNARNMVVLAGPQLNTPRDRLVVWTPGGQPIGGTGHAIRAAEGLGIEVRNLGDPGTLARAQRWLQG